MVASTQPGLSSLGGCSLQAMFDKSKLNGSDTQLKLRLKPCSDQESFEDLPDLIILEPVKKDNNLKAAGKKKNQNSFKSGDGKGYLKLKCSGSAPAEAIHFHVTVRNDMNSVSFGEVCNFQEPERSCTRTLSKVWDFKGIMHGSQEQHVLISIVASRVGGIGKSGLTDRPLPRPADTLSPQLGLTKTRGDFSNSEGLQYAADDSFNSCAVQYTHFPAALTNQCYEFFNCDNLWHGLTPGFGSNAQHGASSGNTGAIAPDGDSRAFHAPAGAANWQFADVATAPSAGSRVAGNCVAFSATGSARIYEGLTCLREKGEVPMDIFLSSVAMCGREMRFGLDRLHSWIMNQCSAGPLKQELKQISQGPYAEKIAALAIAWSVDNALKSHLVYAMHGDNYLQKIAKFGRAWRQLSPEEQESHEAGARQHRANGTMYAARDAARKGLPHVDVPGWETCPEPRALIVQAVDDLQRVVALRETQWSRQRNTNTSKLPETYNKWQAALKNLGIAMNISIEILPRLSTQVRPILRVRKTFWEIEDEGDEEYETQSAIG